MSEQQPKKSDLSRAFSEDGAKKTHIGGQALIEGIMMRGKLNWAVAVRTPNGDIYVEEHDLASGKQKNGWMYWPLVRGCRALVESLVLGFKALEIAALHAFGDEEGEEKALEVAEAVEVGEELDAAGAVGKAEEKAAVKVDGRAAREAVEAAAGETTAADDAATAPKAEERCFDWKRDFGNPDTMVDGLGAQRTLEVVQGEPVGCAAVGATEGKTEADADEPEGCVVKEVSADEPEMEFGHKDMVVSMVFGVVLGVVLFIVAPAVITNLVIGEYDANPILWNVVDGILRVAVFVFYLWLIGRMEDIRRMFMYHGAEHKTIHCYEHELPLTVENARSFPRLHVRCGTAFLIMVMIIAILVYTIFPLNSIIATWGVPDGLPKLALVILVRILLMPVIAGLSYEITVRWAGSHPDNPLVKVVLWPGMQMQYLTTNEPDDQQLECAIAAMQKVLERERAAV